MPEIRMRYWKAQTTFGEEATKRVISDPKWKKQYPELYQQLESFNKRVQFDAILPEPMVLEMAVYSIYAYEADPDGERLYCLGYKDKIKVKPIQFLSALDAVQEYGSECVFMATDKSVGYKWEVDTFGKDSAP